MIKYIVILLTLITILFINTGLAQASSNTFRCFGKFVSLGEPQDQVKRKCGEPSSRNRFDDMWVYDFGPSYFVIYVKFANGKVYRIRTGGYGTGD